MWQGIPFKFLGGSAVESTNIVISKIPQIAVDSSPDFMGTIATFLGTLAAGCLTAFVAWRAIKANSIQMLQQQLIINRQKFIDELRLKIAAFITDSGVLSIKIAREMTSKKLEFNKITKEQQQELIDISHSVDMNHNYIKLMIGSNPNFDEVMEIIDVISDGIDNMFDKGEYYNLTDDAKKLIKIAIKSIDDEWESVITKDK